MPASEVDYLLAPLFYRSISKQNGCLTIHPFTSLIVALNTLYCHDLLASMLPPQDLKFMKAAIITTISQAPSKCQDIEIIIC